jgi:uncharacterized protein YkwD
LVALGLLLVALLACQLAGRGRAAQSRMPEATRPIAAQTATPTRPNLFPAIFNGPTPTPSPTPLPVTPPASGDWRTYLTYYRAVAHLPALAENAGWSQGAFNHAQYMVENQTASSAETPGDPFYTVEGADAGPNSVLQLQGNINLSDRQALDQWMQWPFHAIEILDPGLASTGFGSYRRDAGTFDMAAALDVRRGLGSPPGGTSFPIKWPDHNSTVYLTHYDGNEQPDPLTSCPGFGLGAGSGLPILLQIGPGNLTPMVAAHSFRLGTTALEHCIFDETNYANSIPSLQTLGRALLGARDAIVLIPRDDLTVGSSYTVSIAANGQLHTWTFRVAAPPP